MADPVAPREPRQGVEPVETSPTPHAPEISTGSIREGDAAEISTSSIRGDDAAEISTSSIRGDVAAEISTGSIRGDDAAEISTGSIRGDDAGGISTGSIRGDDAGGISTGSIRGDDTAEIPTASIRGGAPRRRRTGWIIALAVIGALLVVAFVVVDSFARSWATGFVRERVVAVLGLPPDAPVHVELSGGSILWQALLGRVDEVRVDVGEFAVGDLAGSAQLTARGVPIDPARAVESLDVRVSVAESEVAKLAEYFSGFALSTVELRDDLIHVGTDVEILFFTIPVSLDLAPSAVEGGISFDPQVVAIGPDEFTVADLRASPEFSAIAGTLLAARDFCVADRIPAALSVGDVEVTGDRLVITLTAHGVALTDPGFSAKGVCPPA